MIKLLEEIDEMLAAMECVAHGMEGRAITEMRGRIQTELSKSHKPVVGGPASASVSEGEQLGNEGEEKCVCVGFDEGYKRGYQDATSEAIEEIHKNYKPRA